MKELIQLVRNFRADRPVMNDHNADPRAVVNLLGNEVDELIDAVKAGEGIGGELADVFWFMIEAADTLGVDLEKEIREKACRNYLKYPAKELQSGDYDEIVTRLKVQWFQSEGDKQFYDQ